MAKYNDDSYVGCFYQLLIGFIVSMSAIGVTFWIDKEKDPQKVIVTNLDSVANKIEASIKEYIQESTDIFIENIKKTGERVGEDFKILKLDTVHGDFRLQSRDIVFDFQRKGKYGESVEISYAYGYGLELNMSRFEKGKYRTNESIAAIKQLVNVINTFLKDDVKQTSKINGFIWGFSDATKVKWGTEYLGDLGVIDNQQYYIKPFNDLNKNIPDIISLSKDLPIRKKIYYAFLRAYDLKKFMIDNIRSSPYNKFLIHPDNLVIYVTATPEKKSAHRKVEAKFYFEGLLKYKLDSLDNQTKEKLRKIYS